MFGNKAKQSTSKAVNLIPSTGSFEYLGPTKIKDGIYLGN